MKFQDYTYEVIGKALEVHSILGPGLLESTYHEGLYYELNKCGFDVKKELYMPLMYKDLALQKAYRMDLLVNERIVVEIKAVKRRKDYSNSSGPITYLHETWWIQSWFAS